MCGIAGIISSSRLDERDVRRLIDPLSHRGPDDHGVWVDSEAGVGLGHRRLAILDLSPAGHQPMASADGRYVITYNAEIYNHSELRAELEKQQGAVPPGGWRGHSDTETLLECVSAWGLADTLPRIVGMFAFALWDRKERKLHLVRDRFGEKPLYYGWAGKDFLFASELKAIRAHPRFDGSIDRRALRLFAARTYIPAPLSIYKRLFKLEPGCVLTITPESAKTPFDAPPEVDGPAKGVQIRRYWSYRDVVRRGLEQPIEDEREALEQLEQVLARSISAQSVADVPVGAFLSGGIDSSTIVALYQKYSSQPVRTFTIGFEEAGFNEADDARAVAAHLGTVHSERTVTVKEARDVIPLLPSMYDEPFADSSQIPTFLVSRFAREKVTVALTGDGGDELFGGYNRYFGTARAWAQLKKLPAPLRARAGELLGHLPAGLWTGVGILATRGQVSRHFGFKVQKSLRTIAGARGIEDVLAIILDEWSFEGSPVIEITNARLACAFDLDLRRPAPDALRMMYCDAISYLPDDILCKVDRASMAVSLETRVPFLDHRVAELAARIPIEMKVRGRAGKYILKKLLGREAPSKLFERPKSGFGVPVGHWIKGPLRDWAEDLLHSESMAREGYFDATIVHQRWKDHLSGRRDSTAATWAILMFQSWLREQRQTLPAAA